MTYGAYASRDIPRHDGFARGLVARTAPGAAALAISLLVGTWMLYGRAVDQPKTEAPQIAAVEVAPPRPVPPRRAARPVGAREPRFTGMLAPDLASGVAPVVFEKSVALASTYDVFAPSAPAVATPPEPPEAIAAEPAPLPPARPSVQTAMLEEQAGVSPLIEGPEAAPNAPLPLPRPPEFRLSTNDAPARPPVRRLARGTDPAASAADPRSFFQKLFDGPKPAGAALAYAAPEDTGVGSSIFGNADRIAPRLGAPDRLTAVYDISAHTVYLPDGTRLEAHSGLGTRIDDPRFVEERMRGPTPPALYDLTPRETLFHGVQALRLNPVEGSTFGRSGLLAHTYMLGPRGDSNGCVSFRNYNAFLQAYMRGEVRHLVVVARLS